MAGMVKAALGEKSIDAGSGKNNTENEELLEQLSVFRGIIENIGSLIFSVDGQYCYTSFNEAHAQVMKSLFDADIEIGKSILDYHSISADRKLAKHNIDRALAGEYLKEEGYSGDEQRSRLYFEIFHSPIKQGEDIIGASIIAKDVTERKRAEEELKKAKDTLEEQVTLRTSELQSAVEQMKRSEDLLKETQEITRLGGWEYDVESERVTWTDELYRICGLSPDSHDPSDFSKDLDFFAPEDRRAILQAFDRAVGQGVPYDLELQFVNALGEHLWIRTMAKPVLEDGRIVRISGNFTDITDRKLLEEQLRQSQKMESIGRLAGGVAHDLNNFLTAVQGYIDLTMSQLPEGISGRDNLQEARASIERAADLTRQLLLFSRREPLELKHLDLNAVITELLKMLTSLIGEQYSISTIFDQNINSVNADDVLLTQVLMNLVVNARDAMSGGGEISISTANVTVDGSQAGVSADSYDGDFVRLSISDTGIGMDKDTLAQIFEPFFSTKKGALGTGLGLSVVYGIVAQHGGWIEVESEIGIGSTFSVFLPAYSPEFIGEVREPSDEVEIKVTGKGEKILLVEDEGAVRDVVEKILTLSGYSVTAAYSAEDALNIFSERPNDFDLVFSDVILPGIDGIHLAEQLRETKPGLRVILASGFLEGIDLKSIRNKGFDFMQKPYTRDDLLRQVNQKLDE